MCLYLIHSYFWHFTNHDIYFLLCVAGTIFINDAPPPYPGMTPSAPQQQQGGYAQGPLQQGNGFRQQQNGGYAAPPHMNGGYAAPPHMNGGYPQQQGAPTQGYGGYPPQGQAFGGYPQSGAPQGVGFMYPQQNGYAFANGNQAFVPSSAPPAYDEASKKTN
jgi:hypothetical protein